MKNYKHYIRRIGIMFLICTFMIGMLSGCQHGTEQMKVLKDQVADEDKQNAMGRYIEEVLPYSTEVIQTADLQMLSDGKLALFEPYSGLLTSEDQGNNFALKNQNKLLDTNPYEYIVSAAIKKDGTVAMVSFYYTEEEQTETEETAAQQEEETTPGATQEETTGSDIQVQEMVFNQTEEQTETSEDNTGLVTDSSMSSYEYHYFVMDAEGQVKQLTLSNKSDADISQLCYTDEGILYGCDYDCNIYKIDEETGECEAVCQSDGYVSAIFGGSNKIFILTDKSFMIYNAQDGSLEEDIEVTEFLTNLYGDATAAINIDANKKDIAFLQGDTEDSVYIACKSGLYRHVIDGSLMEQLIDGNLSVLGDPSIGIFDIVRTQEGQFVVLCSNGELYSYTYDATVASIPTKELKVYSLVENETVRQAITVFRKSNPDVYMNYEYGLSTDSGMTIEDAVKNLSVDILSGNSPDILILDGLPMQTYINQNLLLDLAPYFTEDVNQQTYFDNIFRSLKTEEKLYAVPTKFKLSLIVGDADCVNQVQDFASLENLMENTRANKEQGPILNAYTPGVMLSMLEKVDSCHWVKEDGTIDKQRIVYYLDTAKRLYELEEYGLTQEDKDMYQAMQGEQDAINQLGLLGNQYSNNISDYFYQYMQGESDFMVGQVSNMEWDFSIVTSAFKPMQKGDFALWQNGDEKCFTPAAIASICANTKDPDLAVSFLKTMLQTDTQKIENTDGFPVNQEAMEAIFHPADEDEDGNYGYLGMSFEDETGAEKEISLECFTPTGTEKDKFMSIVKTVDTPILNDIRIRNTVLDTGANVLNGSQTVEEAADTICDKLNLYLSE